MNADVDLRLVHLVTRRYRSLQGLRKVVAGISMTMLWMLLRGDPPDARPRRFFLGALVWAVFSIWGSARVERYYRERFGQTMTGESDRWERTPAGMSYQAYELTVIAAAIAMGDGFALLVPILTIVATVILCRDWPYRAHWLLLVVTGAAFSAALFAITTPAMFREWQWRFMACSVPAAIIVGVLDHRLLLRAMPRVSARRGSAERADH
jgi:hypothetical protein